MNSLEQSNRDWALCWKQKYLQSNPITDTASPQKFGHTGYHVAGNSTGRSCSRKRKTKIAEKTRIHDGHRKVCTEIVRKMRAWKELGNKKR